MVVTFALCLTLGSAASLSDGIFVAEGTVVAIQKAEDEVRMSDPHSMGAMVEVWMVHVDNWPLAQKPGFILVEYTHRDPIVKDSELDSSVWKFEVRSAPPAESGTCMSWWSAERSFVATALGVNQKLPPPKELRCFLMQKRPVAVRAAKAQQGKSASSTESVDPKTGNLRLTIPSGGWPSLLRSRRWYSSISRRPTGSSDDYTWSAICAERLSSVN